MQTVVTVVHDNRGQERIVADYLVHFSEKAAKDPDAMEFPVLDAEDVVFVRDEAVEPRDNCTEKQIARLGSFGQCPDPSGGNPTLIHVNPIVLSYRSEGLSCFWVGSPSSGTAQNSEFE